MAQNPIRYTAADLGPVPGPSQTTAAPDTGNKRVEDMTHAELDAYAAAQNPPVDLAGTTTRQDKIDRINDAANSNGGDSGSKPQQ